MGKKEHLGPAYFKDDRGRQEALVVQIKPEDYSFPALLRIATTQFVHPRERTCVLVMATGRTIISPEYIRDVNRLEPGERVKHIADTAVGMQKARSVHILYKASIKA